MKWGRGSWSSLMWFVFNAFTTSFEQFVPIENTCSWHRLITKCLLHHSQRFGGRYFISRTKFNATLLLNNFRHYLKINKSNKQFFFVHTHTRNYYSNEPIDVKFVTDVKNSTTNLKIKTFVQIDKPGKFKLKSLTHICTQ